MYKNATKCNETIGKWCKTKHGASKIIDTFEMYHTAADPEDPDHWDKLPRSTRAAAATGKASSPRKSTQDRSEDDSDEEILMYYDPMPLAYAFPPTPFSYPMTSSAIPDDEVIDAAPLSQGPPPAGVCAGKKRGVKPQHEPA
jgi:hypothetical protein